MGKPEIKNPKKDKFFVKKTQKNSKFLKPSNTSSGIFFVTSSEKEILKKKTEKKLKPQIKSGKSKNVSKINSAKDVKSKKPFDKKKWRVQKYSKKYKLEQWENKRKKVVLQEYYKQIKDDEPKFDVQKIYEQYGEEDENENNLNKDLQESREEVQHDKIADKVQPEAPKKKLKGFNKAREEFQRIKEETIKLKEDIANQKLKRAEAKKQYKAEKLEKLKKLNKKTKKGQPIMKYRMEMLLEQIQKSMS